MRAFVSPRKNNVADVIGVHATETTTTDNDCGCMWLNAKSSSALGCWVLRRGLASLTACQAIVDRVAYVTHHELDVANEIEGHFSWRI